MPYTATRDMGLSRFAIVHAVKTLCDERGSVSVEEIAAHIGCSRRTIERNLPKLIEAGLVTKPGNQRSKKQGFRYSCGEDNHADRR